MRTFALPSCPLSRHALQTILRTLGALLVPLALSLSASSVLWAWPARADVHGDVERLIRNGQFERATQLATKHLQTAPQDPQMRLLQSRILEAQGQPQAAQAVLQSLSLEFPELPEPHNNLAVLYARQGRTQEALDSLNKALLARPDDALTLENLGDLHLHLARQAYQKAAPAAHSASRKADVIAELLAR